MQSNVECAFIDASGRAVQERLLALKLRSIRYYGRAAYVASELAIWCELAASESRDEDASFSTCVARADGDLVGYAELDEAASYIGALYVDAGRAGCGIGSALLALLEDAALRAHCRTLFVDASLNAGAFYRAKGFVRRGTLWYEHRSGKPLAAEQYEKRIVPSPYVARIFGDRGPLGTGVMPIR